MRRLLLSIFFGLCLLCASAQDHHFTQYFASPQILNPANIGFLPGKYRAALLYRDQWRSTLEKPFTSNTANFDIKLNSPLGFLSKDYIGIGLAFMNDHIGVIDYNNNSLVLGMAYHKNLSREGRQYLRAGFQMSLNQSNLNYENLFFSDEFDGVSQYNLGSLETLPSNIFSYTNFNVGIMYTTEIGKKIGLNLGAAIHNVFEPNASYYEEDVNISDQILLDRRYSGSLAMNFDLTEKFSLIPRVLFTRQGPYSRINVGNNFRFRFNSYSNNSVQLGTWLRMAGAENPLEPAAAIALIGFEINGFNLGFSYDLDLKSTTGNNFNHNAFEVSFSYIGAYEDEFVFCPQF